MSARTKARRRAIDTLYLADVKRVGIEEALAENEALAAAQPERSSSWPYAREIVEGVAEHLESIDELIRAHASGWTLERMPNIDRAALRVAAWELAHNPEVPEHVAISEAVELVGELSTDESGRYVNGVLSAIAADLAKRAS